MKILFASNLYPPATQGGYELRLFHLVNALKSDHECVVVTSKHSKQKTVDENGVYRILQYSQKPIQSLSDQISAAIQSQKDAIAFSEIIKTENPDWVCHFNLDGLSPSICAVAHLHEVPQVFWHEDIWSKKTPKTTDAILHPWYQIHQQNPAGSFSRIPNIIRPFLPKSPTISKNLKLPAKIEAKKGIFVSHYQEWQNRDSFIEYKDKRILYAGIPINQSLPGQWELHRPIRLVFAGGFTPDRGIQTLFEALNSMEAEDRNQFHLNLIGRPPNAWAEEWWKSFRTDTANSDVWDIIELPGWAEPSDMPEILSQQDILIFPSSRGEGLPLIMQEAMAAGCLVIASGSGGAGELCRDAGIPIFPTNSPTYLKELLLNYLANPEIAIIVRQRMRDYACEHLDIQETAKEFVDILQRAQ